ncbi:MAG: TPR domain-containing protein [Gammaproteobacteria bacterium]|nr:MAG: TPR domain-containing protein [Gammaproteobacteria bacterium]TND06343.1 MAG: TPR domain-containing protein [Gammaproteobacteria bacterium]
MQANKERAHACYRAGQLAEAKTFYGRACKRDKNDADPWFMLGMINGRLGNYVEAERCGAQAARRRDDHAETWFNLGRAQELLEKFEPAIASYRRAAALRPDWVDAHNNLGNALSELRRYDEALASYHEALRLNPDYLRTVYNIAKLNERRGDWRTALSGFDEVIARDPGFVAARWDRALTLLTGGRLADGWREYEWGFAVGERAVRQLPAPRWNGEPLAGKTVFVCAEQGVGDQILFISCLPDLIARAGHCVVECEARLLPLFARSFEQASFLPAAAPLDALARPVDMFVPMGTLPGLFRPELAAFPDHRGFLKADPQRVAF